MELLRLAFDVFDLLFDFLFGNDLAIILVRLWRPAGHLGDVRLDPLFGVVNLVRIHDGDPQGEAARPPLCSGRSVSADVFGLEYTEDLSIWLIERSESGYNHIDTVDL